MYSGLHLLRPCVFLLLMSKRLEITVTRNLPVQSRHFFVIIKRSISEFSECSPIARELQRATNWIL